MITTNFRFGPGCGRTHMGQRGSAPGRDELAGAPCGAAAGRGLGSWSGRRRRRRTGQLPLP